MAWAGECLVMIKFDNLIKTVVIKYCVLDLVHQSFPVPNITRWLKQQIYFSKLWKLEGNFGGSAYEAQLLA